MTLLKTARDKGAMARIILKMDIPLCAGEAYEIVAGNDLGRVEAYISRLEDTVSCLLREMEIKNDHQ